VDRVDPRNLTILLAEDDPYDFEDLREIVRFLKGWVQNIGLPPTSEADWMV
jgi:hypothetical protein